MMSLRFAVAAWGVGLLWLTPNRVYGQAVSLEGETVEVGRQHGPSLQGSGFVSTHVVVGPGVELTNFGAFSVPQFPPSGLPGFVDVDISATSILITLTRNQTFSEVEQLRFNLSNIPPIFFDVTINPATDWAGFAAQPIRAMAFGNDAFVNLAGLTGLQGQKILLDLNLLNIPEPSGAALGALALGGLGALRRRRAQTSAADRRGAEEWASED